MGHLVWHMHFGEGGEGPMGRRGGYSIPIVPSKIKNKFPPPKTADPLRKCQSVLAT